MKRLFLTSEFFVVAKHIFKHHLKERGLKVLFITTASETHVGTKDWVINDRKAFVDGGFRVIDFTITNKSKEQITKQFALADIIYSTGGNTFHYLKQIQQTGAAEIYKTEVLEKHKIYIGGSAGSIITSPDVSVKNFPNNPKYDPSIKSYKALHLVDFLIFPHWTRKDFENYYLQNQIKYAFTKSQPKIILLTDNQYVKVERDTYKIIDQND
jgi:dipeptidase E